MGVPDVGEPAGGVPVVGVLLAVGGQHRADEPDGRPDLLAPFADLVDRLVPLHVPVDVLDGGGDRPVDDALDAVGDGLRRLEGVLHDSGWYGRSRISVGYIATIGTTLAAAIVGPHLPSRLAGHTPAGWRLVEGAAGRREYSERRDLSDRRQPQLTSQGPTHSLAVPGTAPLRSPAPLRVGAATVNWPATARPPRRSGRADPR